MNNHLNSRNSIDEIFQYFSETLLNKDTFVRQYLDEIKIYNLDFHTLDKILFSSQEGTEGISRLLLHIVISDEKTHKKEVFIVVAMFQSTFNLGIELSKLFINEDLQKFYSPREFLSLQPYCEDLPT